MNQYQLQYAVDVLRYLRGEAEATKGMIDYVVNEVMPELKAWDFGLKDSEVHEAEDELERLAQEERDDDPGDVGYLRRKDAMEARHD